MYLSKPTIATSLTFPSSLLCPLYILELLALVSRINFRQHF